MAICCGGKKQKVSYSVTSTLGRRRSSLKSAHGTLDHQSQAQQSSLTFNASSSSIRQRSHSYFNHRPSTASQLATPQDHTHASVGFSRSSPSMSKNHNRLKMTKAFHQNDANDDRDDDLHSAVTNNLHRSFGTQQQHSIVHSEMIFYCFEILGNHLFRGKHQSASTYGQLIPASIVPPRMMPSELYPLFVTWLIGSDQQLRGCIGTFTPMSLTQGITDCFDGCH